MLNRSTVAVFTLSGFNATAKYRYSLFILTLLCYCLIIVVNVSLILTIVIEKKLHEPMYIFLASLCFNGLYGAVGFYPKFLSDLLCDVHLISYVGCFVQIYSLVVTSSTCNDFFFLVIMGYDRYVAICRPLVYHSVMNTQRVSVLVFAAWFVSVGQMIITIIITSTLRLCGSEISRIYCVNYAIRRLECSASITATVLPAFMIAIYFCVFLLVIYSYFHIMKTCLSSKDDRIKFLQTCLPHLMSFIVVNMCLLFDMLYEKLSTEKIPKSTQNFIAIEFLFFPPLINPLIYGLKLNKVRNRIEKFLCR
uniref:G-protein coupled receptors family 1 profile domain-containing protein n=1 Tax=Tetraodon nigroviridis TaxID=99883 RepID=H3C3E7_TETNG